MKRLRQKSSSRLPLATVFRLRMQGEGVPAIAAALKSTPEEIERALLRAEDLIREKPWLAEALGPYRQKPMAKKTLPLRGIPAAEPSAHAIRHISKFSRVPAGDLTGRLMGDPAPDRCALTKTASSKGL